MAEVCQDLLSRIFNLETLYLKRSCHTLSIWYAISLIVIVIMIMILIS